MSVSPSFKTFVLEQLSRSTAGVRGRAMAAVRAFAGPNPERAVVEPEAKAALVRYDTAVAHYDVVEGPGLTNP